MKDASALEGMHFLNILLPRVSVDAGCSCRTDREYSVMVSNKRYQPAAFTTQDRTMGVDGDWSRGASSHDQYNIKVRPRRTDL